MNCRTAITLIIEYLSGALDSQTTLAWNAHLFDCNDCLAFLETYRRSVEAVRCLSSREISHETRSRIQRSLERRIRQAPFAH